MKTKLLVCTQKIDKDDSTLGFFTTWVTMFSQTFDEVSVLCLEKGNVDVPSPVSVFSLGKENGKSKIKYVFRFLKYIVLFHKTYDAVFVHMNEEYVLLGGIFWRLFGKKVYLWRNHPKGSFKTRIAIWLSNKVFYTSPSSFTARFNKAKRMSAGVDTGLFKMGEENMRTKYSVCMVGRISPIKHILEGILAMETLHQRGVQVTFGIIGKAPERDAVYLESLKDFVLSHNLTQVVKFEDEVSPYKLPEIYNRFEVCLNLTDTGSFDKTIVEASSSGAVPIVSNESLRDFLPAECVTERSPEAIATAIQNMFEAHVRVSVQEKLREFVLSQSLDTLMEQLKTEIYV